MKKAILASILMFLIVAGSSGCSNSREDIELRNSMAAPMLTIFTSAGARQSAVDNAVKP